MHSPEDIVRFARWTRTILLILLHRAGRDDEEKGMQFVAQATDILRTAAGKKVCQLRISSFPALKARSTTRQTRRNGFLLKVGTGA